MSSDQYVVDSATVVAKYKQLLADVQEQLMISQAAVDQLIAQKDQLTGVINDLQADKLKLAEELEMWRDKATMVEEIKDDIAELNNMHEPLEGTD